MWRYVLWAGVGWKNNEKSRTESDVTVMLPKSVYFHKSKDRVEIPSYLLYSVLYLLVAI